MNKISDDYAVSRVNNYLATHKKIGMNDPCPFAEVVLNIKNAMAKYKTKLD